MPVMRLLSFVPSLSLTSTRSSKPIFSTSRRSLSMRAAALLDCAGVEGTAERLNANAASANARIRFMMLVRKALDILHPASSIEEHDALVRFHGFICQQLLQSRQARRAFRRAEDSFGRANYFRRVNQFFVSHSDRGSARGPQRVKNQKVSNRPWHAQA